ncbi:MAG: glycosyltransferase family 61 protein [Bacteroidetes bacterium]|nr:glycosyltransferase family 61 protein [Bacteroidota bacterium]
MRVVYEPLALPANYTAETGVTYYGDARYPTYAIELKQLSDVRVTHGGLIMQGWQLLPQSAPIPLNKSAGYFKRLAIYNRLRYPAFRPQHQEPLGIIHTPWTIGNYYHWLLESLPRLLALQQSGLPFRLLLPRYAWQRLTQDTLAAFGIQEADIVFSPGKAVSYVHEVLLPATVPQLFTLYKEVPDAIARLVAYACAQPAPRVQGLGPRIYISRGKAGFRLLSNEAAVWELLQAHGYQKVYMEDYSLYEQIHLMQNTRQLVASHGSGLVNLAFLPQGSHVLEMFRQKDASNTIHNRSYWVLANVCGIHYHYQACPADRPQEHYHVSDFAADLDVLEANLKRMES